MDLIRVLVVDDDKLTRLGIISYMPWERHGMTVVGNVQNGEKALEFLSRTRADLVFVDLDMPVMDGLTFIEKGLEEFPELQYVVLTFHEDFSYVQRVLRLGVLDYISKMQLESEDGDQVLSRIRTRFEASSASTGASVPDSDQMYADEWEAIKEQLDNHYWLYNHEEFAKLTKELLRTPFPARSLEHLAARIQHQSETTLGFAAPPPPAFGCGKDLTQWLESYRTELRNELLGRSDLNDFSVVIMKTEAYIDQHIDSPLNADDVAARVNLSRSYFSILFKKMTGVTYNEFVRRRRVEAAKSLLNREGLSISDIARMVGYEDVGYFTKVFSKHTQLTPAEYRRISTNTNQN